MSDPEYKDVTEDLEVQNDAVIGWAFRWSLVVIVLVVALIAIVIFVLSNPKGDPAVVAGRKEAAKGRAKLTVDPPKILLTSVIDGSGIDFIHANGATGEKLLPETMGGGVAFFDYNNDNRPDLLFVNSRDWIEQKDKPQPTLKLYRNDGASPTGQPKFTDVTADAGLDVSLYGMGVACGDFDNDGWVDLFITAVGPNKLFRNNQGKFADVTAVAGVAGADTAWSTCAGFFDIDNDGDLDLFVGNYVQWSKEIDRELRCTLDGTTRAYCRPDAYQGAYPYLYRNEGNGKFADVSKESGVQVQNPDTKVPLAKSLGLSPADFDGDGWIDFIVANDTVRNLLFHNLKNGTFEEIGVDRGIAYDEHGRTRGAMGTDVAKIRNNEIFAVAVGNFALEPTGFYCSTADSPMQFTDTANAKGVGELSKPWLKFGLFFADFDNDRRMDMLTANGHLDEDVHKVQDSQQYAQPPQLFWNCGPKQATEFIPVSQDVTGAEFHRPIVARGASFADVDADGDLDVVLTTVGGKPRLFRNDQKLGNHWLRVKLLGKKCNHDAIGAWVEVQIGEETLSRQVMPTRSYLSQSELPVAFGLGSAEKIDKLTIRWPGGEAQTIASPGIDSQIEVQQQ